MVGHVGAPAARQVSMTAHRGFALAAVLAALVVMAMVVAVGAQRALVGSRESALALARAEMAAAAAGAAAAVTAAPADSAHLAANAPGAMLDSGSVAAGSARASWRLTAALLPYAVVEIDVRAPVIAGSTRERRRLIMGLRPDTAGALWWVPIGGGGQGRVPAP
jgi:hypothetical protein